MIGAYIGKDQLFDRSQAELDVVLPFPAAPINRSFITLRWTAMDQQTVFGAHMRLRAGAGNAVLGAVRDDM